MWLVDVDGSLSFLADLAHCDRTDPIRELRSIRTAGINMIVAVHGRCVNVWRLAETQTDQWELNVTGECVWSRANLNVLMAYPLTAASAVGGVVGGGGSGGGGGGSGEVLLFSQETSWIRMQRLSVCVTKRSLRGRDAEERLVEVKLIDDQRKHQLTTLASGRLNLICLPTSNDLADLDIFYCDNKGMQIIISLSCFCFCFIYLYIHFIFHS